MNLAVTTLITIFLYCICVTSSPIVTIKNGTLQGSIISSRTGRDIYAFQGIPYARPPIGELRFEVPHPADAWTGVLTAQQDSEICVQKDVLNGGKLGGSEDCLYINVYTPSSEGQDVNKKYPVMVWLHGGGWYCGSGYSKIYGPRYLLDHDVILVTINYRLGILGFLSTEDEVLPGNLGMKDQVQGLRWVNENIAEFGGDVNSITIFGESAGGASVHYHMISPLSKGLFHRAISQSGTAHCPWGIHQSGTAKEKAERFGAMLNCPTSSSSELVACLRKVKAADIVEMQDQFKVFGIDPIIPFRPVVEPDHPNAFLREDPNVLLAPNDVPWLTGINLHEGSIRVLHLFSDKDNNPVSLLDEKWSELAPMSLMTEENFPQESQIKSEVTNKIREFYFGNKKLDETSKFALIDMYTDAWFGAPVYKSIKTHLQKFSSPVYFYHFAYRGRYSLSNIFSLFDDYGVCHGDEIQYIFPTDIRFFFNLIGLPISTEDDNMVVVMTRLWYNFANTGNPTPDVTEKNSVKWMPVQSDSLEYLDIRNSTHLKMSKNLNGERMAFWESIPYRQNLKQSFHHADVNDVKEEL